MKNYIERVEEIQQENDRLLTMRITNMVAADVELRNSYPSDNFTKSANYSYDAYATLLFNCIFSLYQVTLNRAEVTYIELQEQLPISPTSLSNDIFHILLTDDVIIKNMNSVLCFEEDVIDHRVWWEYNLKEGKAGYSEDFVELINEVLKRADEKKAKLETTMEK